MWFKRKQCLSWRMFWAADDRIVNLSNLLQFSLNVFTELKIKRFAVFEFTKTEMQPLCQEDTVKTDELLIDLYSCFNDSLNFLKYLNSIEVGGNSVMLSRCFCQGRELSSIKYTILCTSWQPRVFQSPPPPPKDLLFSVPITFCIQTRVYLRQKASWKWIDIIFRMSPDSSIVFSDII